jgi:signal transduction histidine kinase
MTPILAPARWLTIAAAMALLLTATTFYITIHQPWLGVEFKTSPETAGLTVVAVDPRSPNYGILTAGDLVVGISDDVNQEAFNASTLLEGGVNLPTYAAYNQFLDHHRALWQIINHHAFYFVFADGHQVRGHVHSKRPISSLPWQFWFITLIGITTFLIGVAIWAYRSEQIAARLVLIGGAGFFPATLFTAFAGSRELTMSDAWLKVCTDGDSLGATTITYSIVALLWHYPVPLGRFPIARICGVLVALIWGNEIWQLFEWPLHAYVSHYLIAFLAMAIIATLQWRHSRNQALPRAALQWFLLTLILGSGIVALLFFGPVMYVGKPLIHPVLAYAMAPLMYIGLAFGIARYRLFDLERWWLEVWLWLAGGLLVIGFDISLITLFQFTDMLALGFALVLTGWVYLPLRQWLFRRVLHSTRPQLDNHLPLLIETLFRDDQAGSFNERWRELIENVFAPMELNTQSQPITQTELADSGLALHIPSFDGQETLKLRFREQGRRLYGPLDTTVANSLLSLTRRVATLWQERETSVRTERQRIMRDLHDDVAARLLTLVHRVQDASLSTQARDALHALRQTIYELDEQQPILLNDLLLTLQAQLRERARPYNIEVDWQEPATLPAVEFGARAQINIQRILTEAASNAINHTTPSRFSASVQIENQQLQLRLCNDGAIAPMTEWIHGKGINHIKSRMAELGGTAHWRLTTPHNEAQPVCCIELTMPLPQSSRQRT